MPLSAAQTILYVVCYDRKKRLGGEPSRFIDNAGIDNIIVINALDVYIVRCEVVFMRETSIRGAL